MKVPEKQRQAALIRIKNRVARLQRLIDLEAPDVILIMETQLVSDAAEMLNPEAWYRQLGEKSALEQRRRLGLCIVPDCEASVVGGNAGPFDHDHCEKHAKEAEKEMAEDDLIEPDPEHEDDDDEETTS